ncbi:LPS-assembly protein LptD [Arcobacter sp. s6]|uniref:LPS-assembly protein LptD n=1 Tax=Arcobacter sp. s6 TaxID=3230363 RepID=UPI00349FDF75
MHKKIIASLIITSSLLYSQEIKNEKFQLISKDIDSKNNIVIATGNVVVFSPTYYLSADKIIYNKDNETFELFNNVLIIKDNNIQTQSEYAFVDLKKDSFNQNPMFLYENKDKIWMNSNQSTKETEIIQLDSTILSSCDCLDPVWSIRASSADYNTEDKWINTYNPRLYIKNVPVFYSPYLGFSADKTRRTGLLIPTLGYSSSEGLYYSQPMFFAPAQNYDFELVPQIRTNRGYGSYLYYRYADSQDSILEMKTGIFKEQDQYVIDNSLDSDLHYGFDLDYQKRNLFTKSSKAQDGLYTSINYLNDIEYITLENDDTTTSSDSEVESKINYFYNTNDYYTGVYGRYYIDTDADSNAGTLQEVPQVQFHSYNKESFIDNLVYSLDTKASNYTRDEGITANVYKISAPISYSKYFFDDFMYLNLENEIVLMKYDYDNFGSDDYEDGNLIQNRASVSVGSDLIKPYDKYLHTINLNAKYSVPTNLKEDGDLYQITTESGSDKETELEAFDIVDEEKNIELSINQSIYGKNSLKQLVNHKVSQSILYDDLDNPKLQDFENYVKINHDFGSVSGKTVYNVQDEKFVENSASSTFTYKDASLTLGYYQSKATDNDTNDREDLESYRVSTSYQLSKDYKVSYYENYNLLDNELSKQGVSLGIDDDCWNLNLKFQNEIVSSSSSTSDGTDQKVFFVSLLLKPLGGINQKYEIEDDN